MSMPSQNRAAGGSEQVYAVTFEARHDCIVGQLSRRLPDLRIVHWCIPSRAVFQVSGPHAQLDGFEAWVEARTRVLHRSVSPESRIYVTSRCCAMFSGTSVTAAIEKAGAWDIPPIVYHEGWESWRVLVWGQPSVRTLFGTLRRSAELRILSLRPIEALEMEKTMLVPASDLFAGLTDRQILALNLGLERGHYSLPSRANVEKLAQEAGVAPSTFCEHLRKAEARVLLNLQPHLRAFSLRRQGEPRIPSIQQLERTRPVRALAAR